MNYDNIWPGLILDTETAAYPLRRIGEMLEDVIEWKDGSRGPRYALNPERVGRPPWSGARKSRLMESFLTNMPVPPITLHESYPEFYEVIDGNRRLTAVADFYADEFPLEDLRCWPEIEGRRYSELSPPFRHLIDRRRLSAVVILNESNLNGELLELIRRMARENLNPDEGPDC